ncbi:hypothetical protein [Vagococcus fessus]|uniref:DUF5067 domain-containing protein n=1 Tax=Vagococcus fessus TaxID=120370 RepID=A0A430A7U7_9ENTE|nr:hypothetical protein [Vagococcus fessus]RSU03149.1 hypothetical protein CBF31_05380 [Vagococcus fessus]
MKKTLFRTALVIVLLSLSACTPDPPRNGKTDSSKKIEKSSERKKKVTSKYPNNTLLGVLDKENLEKEDTLVFSEKTDTGFTNYTVDSDNIIKKIELNFEDLPLNKKLNKIFFLSAIEEQLPSDAELKDTKDSPTDSQLFASNDYNLSYDVKYTINNNDEVTLIAIEATK